MTEIVGTKQWSGSVTMLPELAAEFELGVVYWLEQKEPDLMRPMFRRRAQVVSIEQNFDSVTVGFVEVPNPPTWSQETDPESRQIAGL